MSSFTARLPHPVKRFVAALVRFADRGWYALLVAALAGADQFVIFIPIEALLLPSVMLRPRRWLYSALCVATGCAIGALALAAITRGYGLDLVQARFPRLTGSGEWARAARYLEEHGAWALLGIAVSPIPQQPAIAFAGVSRMPLIEVFFAIWGGRIAKYTFMCWAASHAPGLLRKLRMIK